MLDAAKSDRVPHRGSAVQELADLIQGDRALVIVLADRAPFLQYAGQGRIGPAQFREIWAEEIDGLSGERRAARGERLKLTGRPLGAAEATIRHALAADALVEPQLIRAPLAQLERGVLVAWRSHNHRGPSQVRQQPAGQRRWQRPGPAFRPGSRPEERR